MTDLHGIAFSVDRSAPAWVFERDGKTVTLRPAAQLLVNSSEVAIQAALSGAGFTRVLSYMIAADVRAGRLRVVLEDYEPEPVPIQVVYREGRRAPARARIRGFRGGAPPGRRGRKPPPKISERSPGLASAA